MLGVEERVAAETNLLRRGDELHREVLHHLVQWLGQQGALPAQHARALSPQGGGELPVGVQVAPPVARVGRLEDAVSLLGNEGFHLVDVGEQARGGGQGQIRTVLPQILHRRDGDSPVGQAPQTVQLTVGEEKRLR